MFGKINNEQNVINVDNCGKLMNNPQFVAVSAKISEDSLYNLIQNYYNNNDREHLLKSCDQYKKYEYKKYLDIINKYIVEYK
jgi:hypothetical protein